MDCITYTQPEPLSGPAGGRGTCSQTPKDCAIFIHQVCLAITLVGLLSSKIYYSFVTGRVIICSPKSIVGVDIQSGHFNVKQKIRKLKESRFKKR